MIRMRLFALVLMTAGWYAPAGWAANMDSLGIEVKEGKTYVIHRVEPQETLYGLSRRYHTSVETIKSYNNLNGESLTLGVVLRIPWHAGIVHQVKSGETLYTLSKIYGVSIDDLRTWNRMDANDLEVDQILYIGTPVNRTSPTTALSISENTHVVQPSETLFAIANKYEVSVDDIKNWNHLEDNAVRIGDRLIIKPGSVNSIDSVQAVQAREPAIVTDPDFEEEAAVLEASEEILPRVETGEPPRNARHSTPLKTVKERGVAAVFEGDDTKKYLALHRTAPVGTIMQVRNEMTNLTVFVRVVGKLPDTGDNNNVLLRLSRAAQTGLGALDSRFRVELSYMPAQ